ncbi:MAG: hypothetical protein JWO33_1005 [Caulobacteraceae bacterium]|nr:hypothetical protein [Caulobacteraceae bacterium]
MNYSPRWDHQAARQAMLDELLVDAAVRMQLSPTLHDKAVAHADAINKYLDRRDSPLRGRVTLVYPQGSMAIGATIRSAEDDDLFDIDLIIEVDLPGTVPCEVLDLLFEALNGEEGSRYHGAVERQTRCVTIYYEDMHLDVTPLFRADEWAERGGHICHAKPEEGAQHHDWVPANPWGFARWFKEQTPADEWFRQMVLQKSLDSDRLALAEAPSEPVPDHEEIYAKPMAVVALQLMKRWVRVNHDRRGGKGRCVPSVALSLMFGTNAGQTGSLSDELIFQATALHDLLSAETAAGRVIDLRNPKLDEDCLTDRWPGDVATQSTFAEDLAGFITTLEQAQQETDVETLQTILVDLFGEQTSRAVVKAFYERAGTTVKAGESKVMAKTAAVVTGLSRAPAAETRNSPPHRFYGD